MPRGGRRRRRVAIAAAAALLAIVTATATAHRFADPGPVGGLVVDALAAVAAPVRLAAAQVRGVADAFLHASQLREENRRLREQLSRYRQLEHAMRAAVESQARLRSLLGIKEVYRERVTAARVVMRAPDRWFEQVIIDAGEADGVAVGMPVVAAEGLVGRVVATSPAHSLVMLVTDPDSGVGGVVLRTGEAGAVLGSHVLRGRLLFRLYVAEARLRPGDLVVTSGYGGAFPPGLPIGVVEQVERGRLTPLATLRPVVDLDRLAEVLVLRAASPQELPPSPWLQPREPEEERQPLPLERLVGS